MKDEEKSKAQLIQELTEAREKISALEQRSTLLRQVEEALQEQEGLLKSVIQNLPFDFFARDRFGRLIFRSDSIIWNAPIGSRIEDVPVAEKIRAQWQENNRRAMQGEVVDSDVEYQIDDEPRQFRSIVGPVYVGDEIYGILGVNIEITERKQADELLAQYRTQLEELVRARTAELERTNFHLEQEVAERKEMEAALRESQQNLQALFDNALDAIMLANDDGFYVDANPAACALLGYSLEQLTRMCIWDLVPEYQQSLAQKEWQEFLTGGKLEGEITLQDKNGATVEVGFKAVANIIPGLHLSIMRNLTQRKQAEARLRESEERYRIISEALSSIAFVYEVDANGKFSRLWITEESVEQLTGFTFQEFTACGGWGRLIHPDDRLRVKQHSRELLANNESVVEYRVRTKEGEYRWTRTYARPIWDDVQGRVTRVYGGCQDITDFKLLEEQLRQSQKMEALGHMAGGVAHHFNNILTTILGYVDLSLDTLPAQDAVTDNLNLVRLHSQRAAALTRQLLAFTRRQLVQLKVINLNDSIRSMDGVVRHILNDTIDITLTLAPDLGSVEIGAGQFERLLVNLVTNARDAMPEGGKLIIRTRNVDLRRDNASRQSEVAPDQYVLLTVTDTGLGMAEEVQKRAFEPFFTTKEVGQGTGLGLSTCYGIVSQHGGYIVLTSEPGEGTTVSIYLPTLSAELSEEKSAGLERLTRGSETILVVEDEPSVRQLITRILRYQGYTVVEAASGIEALELVETDGAVTPALLLTDVIMPHMRGETLAAKLKAKYPNLGVIFMSGYGEKVISKTETSSEASDLLLKPFTPTLLTQKVRQIIDSSQS